MLTKAFHNALHGGRFNFTDDMAAVYLERSQVSADALTGTYDVYIVHDPQPAAMCRIRRRQGDYWVWRCHVDSSTPDSTAWDFLRPLVEEYDGAVFTMKEFVWKAKPVVAGEVGGIPLQVPTAYHRFLTDSIDDCAAKIVALIDDAEAATHSAKPEGVMSASISCCRASYGMTCASCATCCQAVMRWRRRRRWGEERRGLRSPALK